MAIPTWAKVETETQEEPYLSGVSGWKTVTQSSCPGLALPSLWRDCLSTVGGLQEAGEQGCCGPLRTEETNPFLGIQWSREVKQHTAANSHLLCES